jgi:hypothetical protein
MVLDLVHFGSVSDELIRDRWQFLLEAEVSFPMIYTYQFSLFVSTTMKDYTEVSASLSKIMLQDLPILIWRSSCEKSLKIDQNLL